MPNTATQLERELLSCCYIDGDVVDQATGAGITCSHFTSPTHAQQWAFICDLRANGKATDAAGVYGAAVAAGVLDKLGGVAGIGEASGAVTTSLHAGSFIEAILSLYAQRRVSHLLLTAGESIQSGTATVESLRHVGERVAELCSATATVKRDLAAIGDEAIRNAKEAIAGTKPTRTLIYTGLPAFDRYASPMEAGEYVVVGARTSHGKTSFLLQVAGESLARNLRVAVFVLESTDTAVFAQIAAQRAGVNLKDLANELPAKQSEYLEKLAHLKQSKNLLIFDKDTRLTAIEARCRLLANSFKPDLVILDYLQLVGIEGSGQYDQITRVSRAMIPLRKTLGCTLMVGSQLGRTSEREEREPSRTDFRDSGAIEEDAHRIICLYRRAGQPLDLTYYESEILQLKNRDGGLCKVAVKFNAPVRKFIE